MRFLIVQADFYKDISAALLEGAVAALTENEHGFDVITVPGALEIPAAIAIRAEMARQQGYDGYIALGCIIRGETYHFEIVANESARGLMDLSTRQGLAIGNGILTVENKNQASARADAKRLDKGGDAARAAIILAELENNDRF